MKLTTKLAVLSLVVGLGGLFAGPAAAGEIYSFVNITSNSVADAAIGEAQLAVEVSAVGSNQVSFKFTNSGPAASSITDVYFDDGTLLGIASIIEGPGVNFSQGASPPDLPGGNSITPQFDVTAGFLADSDSPMIPQNGVNPGEFVTIVFNLINGKTFADTIAALDNQTDLRIGIHVQAFADEGSASFVNKGRGQVPEPGSALLLGLGLAGLAFVRRRRSR